MRCRATADGDDWVLNGQKSWISNAGISEYYTVLAVTGPDGKRGSNISAFVVEQPDTGFSFGAKEEKLCVKGSPTREPLFDQVRIPGDRRGPEERTADVGPHAGDDRRPSGRHRAGRALVAPDPDFRAQLVLIAFAGGALLIGLAGASRRDATAG